MKRIIKILMTISVAALLTGCRGAVNKPAGQGEAGDGMVTGTVAGKTIEEVYLALPRLGLPLVADMQLLHTLGSSPAVAQNDMERLAGIGDMESGLRSSAKLARLPELGDKRFILAGEHVQGEWTLDLYCLTDGLDPTDRLRLYSVETLSGGKSRIARTFLINNDYRIEVSKHLNSVLIERLTYVPTPDGTFEELRDGQTATVAYDSYDGINYIVRTFIWDRNPSGGLIMKDLREENYKVDNKGDLVTTDNVGS